MSHPVDWRGAATYTRRRHANRTKTTRRHETRWHTEGRQNGGKLDSKGGRTEAS